MFKLHLKSSGKAIVGRQALKSVVKRKTGILVKAASWQRLAMTRVSCSSSSSSSSTSVEMKGKTISDADATWREVQVLLEKAFKESAEKVEMDKLILRIYNDEILLHEAMTGDGLLTSQTPVAVASAAKLVTGLLVLRLVSKGVVSLEDSLALLPGGGPKDITADHLGSFVAGVNTFNPVMFSMDTTLQEAAQVILNDGPFEEEPGATFSYSGTQIHLLAALCETKTGRSWAELFEEMKDDMGLGSNPDFVYTTIPNDRSISANPMVAGGLICSVEDMAKMTQLILRKGRLEDGSIFIQESLIERLFQNPYTQAKVAFSPLAPMGYDYRYGFASWLHTTEPEGDVISSPGFNGFVPFVDRKHGYSGIVCTEGNAEAFPFAVNLVSALIPKIRTALLK